MSRGFTESIEYLLNNPDLSDEGLQAGGGKITAIACKKEECDGKNPYTNLLCETCRRSPIKLDAVWWGLMILLVGFFQLAYFWFSNWASDFGSLLIIIAFNAFAVVFSAFVAIGIFKGRSAEATIICGGAAALLIAFSYLSYKFGSAWGEFFIYGVIALLLVGFVFCLLRGSAILCKRNNISWLVPFFIVLPANFAAYQFIRMLPFVNSRISEFKGALLQLAADTFSMNDHLWGRVIITIVEWSAQIRLLLLVIFLVLDIWFFGLLPALKARKRGYKILEYIYDLVSETVKNLRSSVLPIVKVWWYVTKYALTKSILAPTLFSILIGACWFLFVGWPMSEYSTLLRLGLSGAAVVAGVLAFPLFVVFAANYPLGPKLLRRVYNDGIKAIYTVLFALLFFAVTIDILKGYVWGVIVPSVTLGFTLIFYAASSAYFVGKRVRSP